MEKLGADHNAMGDVALAIGGHRKLRTLAFGGVPLVAMAVTMV